jgi:hypothetical protein
VLVGDDVERRVGQLASLFLGKHCLQLSRELGARFRV